MAASSGEEEEEYEYEEVEVEEEEEEEYEEVEEEDEEEDEEEVVEEVVELEQNEPEDEPEGEPEDEEFEEVEEEEEEEEVEEEEEPEEDEEEEYEEVVEEVEVTDDEDEQIEDPDAVADTEADAVEDMDTAAMEETDAVADTAAVDAVVEEAAAMGKEVAKYESDVGLSDLLVPTADQPRYDVRQDEQSKGNEACLRSGLQGTVNSKVAAPLDTHAVEAVGSMLGSKSPIQQNRKGKEVLSINDGSSSLQDTVNSKVAAPFNIHAVEAIGHMLASKSPSQQNRKGKEVLSVDDGSSNLPDRLKYAAQPSKLGDTTVEREQGLVEISPVPIPIKDEHSLGKHINPAAASEKHVSAPNGSHDKLRNILTTDIEETRVRSQKEDLPLPLSEIMDQKASRYYTPQITTHIDEPRVPRQKEDLHLPSSKNMDEKASRFYTPYVDDTRIPSQKEDPHLPSIENMDQKALRHYTPQMRPRSLSPGPECEVLSKRSAIVCEYFLKGWCIKGSSCRFLHKRDQVDNARGQVEGATKAEICPGSGDAAGSSKPLAHSRPKYFMTNSDDVLPNSTGGRCTEKDYREHVNGKDNFCVLERDLPHPHPERDLPSKDGSKVFSSQNEEEVDMLKGGRSSDLLDCHGSSFSLGRSTLLDNFTPGNGVLPRSVGITSDTQMNYSLHSYAMVEESVAMRRQYTLDLHSSPVRGNGSGRNTSLLDNTTWKDMLMSYKNERKFTPYNWEPSLPFRPSHYITSFTTSTSGVQYDPLRDSIEQTDIGRGSFRHSYGQTNRPAYQHDQNISCRNSMESHKRHHSVHSDSNEKDNYIPDKDTHVVEADSAAISATGAGNPVVAASVKDVLKATKSISDGNSKLKIDDSRHKGEVGKQNNEIDDEETKAIKVFRAALIEFVKELMKPVWHEGRLSKDVYKVIVQKAEDKILSTLPSNEVPNTPETIKQYLFSSRPNILKLIQAYVDKYGKF